MILLLTAVIFLLCGFQIYAYTRIKAAKAEPDPDMSAARRADAERLHKRLRIMTAIAGGLLVIVALASR